MLRRLHSLVCLAPTARHLLYDEPSHRVCSSRPAAAARRVLQGTVVVIRYEGPKGGPGMPEMLTPTSAIMGAGLGKECALITDGRFSGGSHGFVIGHVCPEAQEGGPIALVKVGGWGWARGQVPVCGGALSAHGTRAGGAAGPIVCPAGVSHWPACLPLMPVSMPPCASLP